MNMRRLLQTASLACLGTMLFLFTLGCTAEKTSAGQNIKEFSLVEMWDNTARAIGIQDQTVHLHTFDLRALNDEIDSLSLECSVGSDQAGWTFYSIWLNTDGKVDWNSAEIDSNQGIAWTSPGYAFAEIDKFGLTNIRPAVSGFTVRIESAYGYSYEAGYMPLYQLNDGTLTPLRHVEFARNEPGLVIAVGSIAVSEPPKRHFEKYEVPELWFLSEDLAKAEVVE